MTFGTVVGTVCIWPRRLARVGVGKDSLHTWQNVNKQTYIKSRFSVFGFYTFLSFLHSSSSSLSPSTMRSIALPALLAATLAYTASANDKPVFKVSLSTPPLALPSLFSHATQSPRKSRHPLSNSSLKVGKTGGHPLRPPRKRLLVVKHSRMSVNGQSKKLPPP